MHTSNMLLPTSPDKNFPPANSTGIVWMPFILYDAYYGNFNNKIIGQTSDHKNTLANEFSCVIKQPWLLHILWQSLHRTSSFLHSTKKFIWLPCTSTCIITILLSGSDLSSSYAFRTVFKSTFIVYRDPPL